MTFKHIGVPNARKRQTSRQVCNILEEKDFIHLEAQELEIRARQFAFSLSNLTIAALLYRQLNYSENAEESLRDEYTFIRFCELQHPLFTIPLETYSATADQLVGLSQQKGQAIGVGDQNADGSARSQYHNN
jgi:hypothetical protein